MEKRKDDFFYNFWTIWYLLVSIDWIWNFIILTASVYDVKGCHDVCLWAMIQIAVIYNRYCYLCCDAKWHSRKLCIEMWWGNILLSCIFIELCFSAFFILWVYVLYIFNYVGFIRGIRKQGRFSCTKERNLNLEIWKFSVNPKEHRIFSLKNLSLIDVLRVLSGRAVCITVLYGGWRLLFPSHGFVFPRQKDKQALKNCSCILYVK